MQNYENSPVNEWNAATARLGYLTGGPLDSLLGQLARAGAAPPTVTAQAPEVTSIKDAPETAGPAPSANSQPTSNS